MLSTYIQTTSISFVLWIKNAWKIGKKFSRISLDCICAFCSKNQNLNWVLQRIVAIVFISLCLLPIIYSWVITNYIAHHENTLCPNTKQNFFQKIDLCVLISLFYMKSLQLILRLFWGFLYKHKNGETINSWLLCEHGRVKIQSDCYEVEFFKLDVITYY